MTWHQHERETLAALLLAVGPDAPTLCAGWRSRHLAVHLLQRESPSLGALRPVPGPVGRLGADALEAAAERCQDPEEYAATVGRFAAAPSAWSPWGFAGDSVNLLEFFVHGEDVRRAGALDADGRPAAAAAAAGPEEGGAPLPPARDLSPDERDTLWHALRLAAPLMLLRVPAGLVYVRSDGPRAVVHRPRDGYGTVVLRGELGDLVLHTFGRGAHTRLVVEGAPDDVASLAASCPVPSPVP